MKDIEEMLQLHHDMMNEIGSDADALELYMELVKTANRYMYFRANWSIWSSVQKLENDPSRTSCHNALIVKFNQLSRYLKMQGKDVKWRDALGYEENDADARKQIGDFACCIVFINSINAR